MYEERVFRFGHIFQSTKFLSSASEHLEKVFLLGNTF